MRVGLLGDGKLSDAGVAVQQIMAWTIGQPTSVCTNSGSTNTCVVGTTTATWDTQGTPAVETNQTYFPTLEGRTTKIVGGKVQLGSEPILLY